MAHFEEDILQKPSHFNFARDVVDYWATKSPDLHAMYWVSQDLSEERILTYKHFENESHRVASLLRSLNVKAGQIILMILPRIPAW
jgi:acyl-coenzyme A synthetase/AMP-(fatty) acid ligase